MSETVHYKGKLIPVQIDADLQEVVRQTLVNHGVQPNPEYSSLIEQLDEEVDEKYFERDGILYAVSSAEIDIDDDIMEATINEDGTIDFEVKYYNGGCCMPEAIECAIERALEKEKAK